MIWFFSFFWQAPNIVGSPLGIFQLVLYCKYRKRRIIEKPHKWDLEKIDDGDDEKHKEQLQIVVAENTNGKL